MVMLIIIFASIFSHVIALIGAPKALFGLVVGLGLPRWAFFAALFAVLLVIAYALEELSVMIIILPILFPLVTGLGFDPIWFGIIMVLWLEIGLITPPVGLNLFVIQTLMPGTTARDITRRSEEHTSELQSPCNLVCRLLLEKKKKNKQAERWS